MCSRKIMERHEAGQSLSLSHSLFPLIILLPWELAISR